MESNRRFQSSARRALEAELKCLQARALIRTIVHMAVKQWHGGGQARLTDRGLGRIRAESMLRPAR